MRMVTQICIDGVFVTPHGTDADTGNARRVGLLRALLEAETR
jgi:hypothetical protein